MRIPNTNSMLDIKPLSAGAKDSGSDAAAHRLRRSTPPVQRGVCTVPNRGRSRAGHVVAASSINVLTFRCSVARGSARRNGLAVYQTPGCACGRGRTWDCTIRTHRHDHTCVPPPAPLASAAASTTSARGSLKLTHLLRSAAPACIRLLHVCSTGSGRGTSPHATGAASLGNDSGQ